MSSGSFTASLFLSSSNPPASLIPSQITGNVGVCLSGGGSRAFSAGIGQLQALETLQANGASLLSQVAVLTTVSGGGWIGIPFTYLPSSFTDADFLGAYTPPASLTSNIVTTPPTGIGARINNDFSIPMIAIMAHHLITSQGVPPNMAWQTIMGITFLQPYGLFNPSPNEQAPTDLFSYDSATLAEYVTGPNTGFTPPMTDLVAQVTGQRRPYLVSICGLSVSVSTYPDKLLAPVQCTPIITGVLSSPGAVDANQRPVGGGGVASFAFNSTPTATSGSSATVQQSRQWSLTDILGTSSAAFAKDLIKQFTLWKLNPAQFEADLQIHGPAAAARLSKAHMLPKGTLFASPEGLNAALALASLPDSLSELVPIYDYWSPVNVPVNEPLATSDFTDGGSLDNSGIASMLSYSNITTIVAFINSEHSLSQDSKGNIIVDTSIPPLFGYQPYSDSVSDGYAPYVPGQTFGKKVECFQFNQVFPSEAFAQLRQQLWAANGAGAYSGAAICTQQLTTVANSWFDVPVGQSITVVWVHLSKDTAWENAISDSSVKHIVDFESLFHHFPNYDTSLTGLSATQVNLLSNFTSWIVQSNAATFTTLFS